MPALALKPRTVARVALGLASLLVATGSSEGLSSTEPHHGLRVGRVELANSGAPEAQDDFAEGLAALHSFWYDAAREAFQRAQEKDPGFAMAYWGEAMSHYRALWSGVASASGKRHLERLDDNALERLERNGTEEERALIEAARSLFGSGSDSGERGFSDALRDAYERLPASIEIGAFYALSLQGQTSNYSRRSEADWRLIAESGAVLDELYLRAPDHPGVLHYLIHAYDDPKHAELGLEAAHRYSQIASDASHAQHMPSHIFLQLGDWESTVASNRRAWSASEKWVEARGLPNGEKDFHALGWLHYALLQTGDFSAADGVRDILTENGGRSSTVARYEARRLVESEEWSFEVSGSDDSSLFARGYAAARRDDLRAARKELEGLKERSGEDAEILTLALDGLITYLDGDQRQGLDLLRRASDREDATRIPSGPPDLIKPALELHGELLLQSGRCDRALEAFDRSLARMPGRRLSVRGSKAATACPGATR